MNTETDQTLRFIFPDSDIRGEIVRLEQSLQSIFENRHYPMEIEAVLGESLSASVLLASTLKFEGRIALQAQGEGDISLLLAECDHQHRIRGLIHHREDNNSLHDKAFAELIGKGHLVITIKPDHGQIYQGMVPLEADSLAGCIEGYFHHSEQLPTRLWLACGNGRAAGLLIQALPNQQASAEQNQARWEEAEALAHTITTEELLNLPMETVLHRLFHQHPPQLFPARTVQFGCTCSREKTRDVLISLGPEELRDILQSQQQVDIQCEFCGRNQHFDAVDLGELIHQLTGETP